MTNRIMQSNETEHQDKQKKEEEETRTEIFMHRVVKETKTDKQYKNELSEWNVHRRRKEKQRKKERP